MSRKRAESELVEIRAQIEKAEAHTAALKARAERLTIYLEVDAELAEATMNTYREIVDHHAENVGMLTFGGGTAGRARRMVERILAQNGSPIPTAVLLKQLREMGVSLTPPEKADRAITDLSAVLSRDKTTFVASRKYGWGLRRWGAAAEDGDAETPDSEGTSEPTSNEGQPPAPPPSPTGVEPQADYSPEAAKLLGIEQSE